MARNSRIASLPEVQMGVREATADLAAAAREFGTLHGSIQERVDYEPIDDTDWLVYYAMYDPEGRGAGGPVEMGHINVPRGGRWTRGIHVLRDAITRCEVF